MNLTLGIVALVLLAIGLLVRGGHASWNHDLADGHGGEATMQPVAGLADLDAVFTASHEAATLLFLHDPDCPISRAAYKQMIRVAGDIPLLDVRGTRALTRAVEQRTGVRHESPQVLVLQQGEAVWSASHYAITVQAVTDALHHAHEDVS